MKKNEKRMKFILLIVTILVAVGVVLFLNKQYIKKEEKAKFLEDIKNVTHVDLEYGMETKKIDNKISKILQNLESNSINKLSPIISNNETGEQPYSFIFYNKNNEELYRLLFTQSNEKICIWKQEDDHSKIKVYLIDNKEVLDYILEKVNDFNKNKIL